jgi:hypothetical protein
MVRIYAQVENNATTQATFQKYVRDHTLIVVGSNIDLSERMLFDTIKLQNPWVQAAKQENDTGEALNKINRGDYILVVLVGGPEQNNITKYAISMNWFNRTDNIEAGFIVKSGKLQNGAVVLAISDKRGYTSDTVMRTSITHSPLSAFMPKEYVPLAATGISVILLMLLNVGRTVFEFKALDIGRKNKKVGEGAWLVSGLNLTEMLAIVGASFVLGASISWQYFALKPDFVLWVGINSILCLFAAVLHEITHRVFAYFFKIRMEYRFWPAGSALTLISSYLGNAFSVQGFILEEIDEGTAKWKVGLMKLAAPLVSGIIMVVFAALNYTSPDPLYKMIYTISGLWAVAEVLPFGSLDGKDIRDWNNTIWFISFVLIGASYFVVTFIL